MALIKSVKGKTLQHGKNCFFAENATILGDVTMGDECSVWFQAVVRGDVHWIKIGNNVSIGHRAIVHGCTIHDNVLVGMGAIVMDHAVVESNVLIAAGAIVLENSHLESGYIYAGIPAKKIKALSEETFKDMIERIANNYVMYASWFEETE
jgi:carbonic anhydrase/acetyltransferase-like protein (isoleucine patch superfamily)